MKSITRATKSEIFQSILDQIDSENFIVRNRLLKLSDNSQSLTNGAYASRLLDELTTHLWRPSELADTADTADYNEHSHCDTCTESDCMLCDFS